MTTTAMMMMTNIMMKIMTTYVGYVVRDPKGPVKLLAF